MATALVQPSIARRRGAAALIVQPTLAVAATASIGAGAIHAAEIGAYNHSQAVVTFTIIAAVQFACGIALLLYPKRGVAFVGVLVNAAVIAGWALAKAHGIAFVDGLEQKTAIRAAEGAAAGLSALAFVTILVALYGGLHAPRNPGHSTLGISALVAAVVALPAMASVGNPQAAAGSATGAAATGAAHVHTAAAVSPTPYDPAKPIDLGGVPGVTPEQQARAENLVAITLVRLPQWSDYRVALRAGFRSIGEPGTGPEHFINPAYFDDGRILDPDHPESLVYERGGPTGKQLVAAMYMLPPGTTFKDVPDIGGKLMQWHIHTKFCFTSSGKFASLTDAGGNCPAGLDKTLAAPMIHVWIRPNPCGPFAAVEGFAAGDIAPGATRLCDHLHGSHHT